MKKLKQIAVLSFLTGLLANCSGESLVSTSTSESGEVQKAISIKALHHASDANGNVIALEVSDDTKSFVNDLGITISLEKAAISWGHLTLISGGDDDDCEAGHDAELHLETIENILDEDQTEIELGTSEIEDRAYCSYTLELTPENADTQGIELIPEITGRTVYVSGTWDNGTASGVFEIAIEEEIVVENEFLSVHDGALTAHPLHFHDGENATSITFANVYDAWFDAITFQESEEDLAVTLKTNVEAALGQWFAPEE